MDDWQKEVLDYRGDFILCTGRRVGKTYILARKAIDAMVEGKNVIIFSLTEEQAMIIIAMALNYLHEYHPKMYSRKKIDTNKRTITLKNGAMMKSRPAGDTGDSGRGFEANVVIIDEASRMNKLFWIAILPIVLMKGGEVWMASTPHGKQGYFWDRFNEAHNLKLPDARYKVFYTTTEHVIQTRKITEDWTEEHKRKVWNILMADKKTMSQLEYGQEYMGLFLDDMLQFFPDDLINACCKHKRQPKKGIIYSGHDIARYGGDEITHVYIDKVNPEQEIYVQRECIVKKHQPTNVTEDEIVNLTKIWDAKKVGIDAGAGSLGVGIFDRLITHDFMKHRVVAMNNRQISMDKDGKKTQRLFKEDMYDNMKAMMERGELRLLDDENIKLSLKSVQLEFDKVTGKTKIFGNYTHIAEGLVRACELAKKEKINNFSILYM